MLYFHRSGGKDGRRPKLKVIYCYNITSIRRGYPLYPLCGNPPRTSTTLVSGGASNEFCSAALFFRATEAGLETCASRAAWSLNLINGLVVGLGRVYLLVVTHCSTKMISSGAPSLFRRKNWNWIAPGSLASTYCAYSESPLATFDASQ